MLEYPADAKSAPRKTGEKACPEPVEGWGTPQRVSLTGDYMAQRGSASRYDSNCACGFALSLAPLNVQQRIRPAYRQSHWANGEVTK
jgi:hypothetical protein